MKSKDYSEGVDLEYHGPALLQLLSNKFHRASSLMGRGVIILLLTLGQNEKVQFHR